MATSGNTAKDYSVRRGEISAYGRALHSGRTLRRIVAAFILLLVLAVVYVLFAGSGTASNSTILVTLSALVLAAGGMLTVLFYTNRHFIEPDLAFRKWLQQVCDGDLKARIDLPPGHRHYKELHFHTKNLASALMQLSTDMETLVDTQTRTLEQQADVLGLLFQVTTDICRETEVADVINSVSRHLAIWYKSAEIAGYVKLPGGIKRVAAYRTENGVLVASGDELDSRQISDTYFVTSITQSGATEAPNAQEVRVPILTGPDATGVLVIRASLANDTLRAQSERVLKTVSEQLSMFTTNKLAAEQAQAARLIQERTTLAADIHDSLAQTLLAIRNQITLIKETTETGESAVDKQALSDLLSAVDIANKEARELIHSNRGPRLEHSSTEALRSTIEQFRETSDIEVFFQCDNPRIRFSPEEQSVVHRIVGESLNNAQKYSNADMIRVYLHNSSSGVRTVLVEDDGVGFPSPELDASAECAKQDQGQHIGLSIMRERALSIGGILNIESEPGDGTRVSLKLPPTIASAGDQQ